LSARPVVVCQLETAAAFLEKWQYDFQRHLLRQSEYLIVLAFPQDLWYSHRLLPETNE